MAFRKATKSTGRARVALVGPSGSGKTYTSLLIARHLGESVALIDTERGSASKYAGDVADFDVEELDQHSPKTYRTAISEAAEAGYDVLVIDSLSHAWMGRGGALEMVDEAAKRSRSSNSFAAWRDVTPEHHRLVDAILSYPGHVIVTMRSKSEWVLEENQRGKKVPRKIGMAPVQRDGVEYEFDVVGDLDMDHTLVVSKSRCPALSDEVVKEPGENVAKILRAWLSDGVDLAEDVVAQLESAKTEEEFEAARKASRRVYARLDGKQRERVAAAGKAAGERIKGAKPAAAGKCPGCGASLNRIGVCEECGIDTEPDRETVQQEAS